LSAPFPLTQLRRANDNRRGERRLPKVPINGTYGGNGDNVTDDGSLNGWADQAGNAYGNTIAFRRCYCFGPVVNNWGTWGQLVYDTPANLSGQDLASPTGLTGHMPANNAPDNSKWVQGHLVNGECGGDGGIAANATTPFDPLGPPAGACRPRLDSEPAMTTRDPPNRLSAGDWPRGACRRKGVARAAPPHRAASRSPAAAAPAPSAPSS